MGSMMPFSKRYGWVAGFVFAFFNIGVYDLITGKLGMWTLEVGVVYGLLAILFPYLLTKKKLGYVLTTIIGTLIFDALTGLTMGPLMFGQSLSSAFYGQIPFTIYHLIGNICFAVILSPVLEKWIVNNSKLEIIPRLRKVKADS
jgi:hypothetical protein